MFTLTNSSASHSSKFALVFFFAVQLIVTLYRAVYWLVFERNNRISRLAYQLEQLNAQESELNQQLAKLNEQYLAEAGRIQKRRNSLALQRTQVLEQLAQSRSERSSVPVQIVKSVPVINVAKDKSSLWSDQKCKLKPVEPVRPALYRQSSATSLAVAHWESKSRSPSPSLWQRPKSADIPLLQHNAKPVIPKIIRLNKRQTAKLTASLRVETPNETSHHYETDKEEERASSKLSNRVNEYIDFVVDNVLQEFRSADQEDANDKQSQRFRDSIKELYLDPEWRPLINDLKRQYKIFCYL